MLLMGKYTISTGPFAIPMLNYQRVLGNIVFLFFLGLLTTRTSGFDDGGKEIALTETKIQRGRGSTLAYY